jgi:hypothetical protein
VPNDPAADPPDYNPEATWEQGNGIGALAAALAKVQASMPTIPRNQTGQARGGRYKYADLTAVSAKVMPLLGKNGLAFTARPTVTSDGRFVLAYSLIHESGERLDGEYPLQGGSAQQLGSEITYARRYSFCAVTGATAEDDDDGAGAEAAHSENGHQARNAPPRPAKGQPGSATDGQVTGVQIAYKDLGFKRNEREDMLSASEQIIGRELTGPHDGRTHKNLTDGEARKLRDTLDSFDGDRGDLLAKLVEAATP